MIGDPQWKFDHLLGKAVSADTVKKRDWARHQLIELAATIDDSEKWTRLAEVLLGEPQDLRFAVVSHFREHCPLDELNGALQWVCALEVSATNLDDKSSEAVRRRDGSRHALITVAGADSAKWRDLREHLSENCADLRQGIVDRFNDNRPVNIGFLPIPEEPVHSGKNRKVIAARKVAKAEEDRQLRERMRGGGGGGGGKNVTDPNSKTAKRRLRKEGQRKKK